MKYLSETYPLAGLDFGDTECFNECYVLAEEFVSIIVKQKKSYAEACKAFDIAKEGLKTLTLMR